MDYVGELHSDSRLLLLPWDNSGVDDHGHGSGENDNCSLECDPLYLGDKTWATFELGVLVDEVFL